MINDLGYDVIKINVHCIKAIETWGLLASEIRLIKWFLVNCNKISEFYIREKTFFFNTLQVYLYDFPWSFILSFYFRLIFYTNDLCVKNLAYLTEPGNLLNSIDPVIFFNSLWPSILSREPRRQKGGLSFFNDSVSTLE